MGTNLSGFNAARGFVSGAASEQISTHPAELGCNAARGFVSGAADSVDGHQVVGFLVAMPHAAL